MIHRHNPNTIGATYTAITMAAINVNIADYNTRYKLPIDNAGQCSQN